MWGGPPDGSDPSHVIAASKLAFAPRGRMQLGQVIGRDLWEINFKKDAAPKPGNFAQPPRTTTPGGAKALGLGLGALIALLLIGVGSLLRPSARARKGRR